MKKEWNKPELEVLDVSMTMLGSTGEFTDASFPDNFPTKLITTS